jgi:hypothetical protein
MPHDKNPNNNKPFLPRLASTKSPITPRLAVQHLRASPSPSVASPRLDVTRSNVVKSPILAREDVNTPVTLLLNSNITPRSALRKSRLETGSNTSTPSGTPIQSPVTDAGSRARSAVRGKGYGNTNIHKRPQSVVLDNHSALGSFASKTTPFVHGTRSGNSSPSDDGFSATSSSTFFHASEAKSMEAPPPPQPKRTPTFIYANGEQERRSNGGICRSPSPTLSTVSTKSHKSQFHHADGRPEAPIVPPRSAHMARNASPELRPPLIRGQSTTSQSSSHFPLRPPSPQKASFHLTFRKGASQILPNRAPVVPILPPVHSPSSPKNKRKSTIEAQLAGTPQPHNRAGSLSSIDTSPSSRKSSVSAGDLSLRQAIHVRGSPSVSPSPRMSQSKLPKKGSIDITSDLRSATAGSIVSQPSLPPMSPSVPQSPGHKSSIQVPPKFAEAAANARRERKVLDLEISNSSLLAINRQLEREVRRQKMELRRFRRLSRAGRLSSLGSVIPDHNGDEDSGSEGEDDTPSGDQNSEGEEASDVDDDESPNLSSLSEESLDSSNMSPAALTERGTARLERDEKRLKLDLDRHRQLLVDSQKMNQSLKRCMAWTEEMIAEGKKALAYKVC